MSKIQSESKSQLRLAQTLILMSCVFLCQRYNLKANHNHLVLLVVFNMLCVSMSKIQSESKSQHTGTSTVQGNCCVFLCQRYNLKANHNTEVPAIKIAIVVCFYVKDTIWKQITTYPCLSVIDHWLCVSMSKIQSESKSQPVAFV